MKNFKQDKDLLTRLLYSVKWNRKINRMKLEQLLLVHLMLLLSVIAISQSAPVKKYSREEITTFGKKLPPPDLNEYPGRSLHQTGRNAESKAFIQNPHPVSIDATKKNGDNYRQQMLDKIKQQHFAPHENESIADPGNRNPHSSNFHLTKDINPLAESFPSNSNFNAYISYAVLDNVVYFAADDGIHGNEFWRSDGTDEGTYMLMDVEPGAASSYPYSITAVNGRIYFSATTDSNGAEPWVSDGTVTGTHLLMDIKPGAISSFPTDFVAVGRDVYFIADGNFSFSDAIWKTDGTTNGTKLVKSLGDMGAGGYYASQLTISNGTLFFTFISLSSYTWSLGRTDGTDGGTYQIGTNFLFSDIPLQLTNYQNQLYFSSNDGSGRKLYISDGTDAGTGYATNNNNVMINADVMGTGFPILNDVLYLPGTSSTGTGGLYKYNALNSAGVVKVQDVGQGTDPTSIVPMEMEIVNNALYFKVTSYNGGVHDELWSSRGSSVSTRLTTKFLAGETINTLYNGSGTLYFVKYDKAFGAELWSLANTFFGTFPVLVSDIFKGQTGSHPQCLTACNGKLYFEATDEKKGTELFITNGLKFGIGATLVKDINTVATSSSNAGGLTPFGRSILFGAQENVHGYEPYKSDGTQQGTYLLNDIIPGEASSYPNFLTKKNFAYFTANSSDTSHSIYKTDGTKWGLRKISPDYGYYNSYYLSEFDAADNGIVFYTLYNYSTGGYELWRSDGTGMGTFILSSTVYNVSSLHVAGNIALFVNGDATHGYELWKSDGSVAGTSLVKDIFPGIGDAAPGGLFVYKNEVYFGAYDGTDHAFWKSDGTEAGTVELKNIDPWWGNNARSTAFYFCISNNILYFSALQYSDGKGTELWKTDGTAAGTQFVKDVNPTNSDVVVGPYNLTDVDGTLFFTADDGEHGNELWKSNGTETGTQLVKDITTGPDPSNIFNLASYAGKLYFINNYVLWSSDGTADGTVAVDDPVISDVQVFNIVAAGDKLFAAGSTHQYGAELYEGEVNDKTGLFAMSPVDQNITKSATPFDAVIYPNPVTANATLRITGSAKNVNVSITDMNGQKLWQSNNSNSTFVILPTAQFAKGTYFVTVRTDAGNQTLKIVKH